MTTNNSINNSYQNSCWPPCLVEFMEYGILKTTSFIELQDLLIAQKEKHMHPRCMCGFFKIDMQNYCPVNSLFLSLSLTSTSQSLHSQKPWKVRIVDTHYFPLTQKSCKIKSRIHSNVFFFPGSSKKLNITKTFFRLKEPHNLQ